MSQEAQSGVERTKKCSKCKEEVLYDAIKCKHCGSELRSWPGQHPILSKFIAYSGLLMLVLIIFIWVLNSIGSIATPVSKINPSPHREQVSPVFDVPSLLGKNINQIRTTLGTPTYDKEPTKLQLSLGVTEWDKSWEREGADLLVTYNIKTKKVIDFFIGGVDPSGSTNDKKLLLDVAGLKEGDPKYKLEFVEVRVPKPEPGFYTGVKVMPQ